VIEVRLSEESVAAAKELEGLDERGELFAEEGDDSFLQSSSSIDQASRRLLAALDMDLLREIGEEFPDETSSRLLNPERPSNRHRHGPHVSAMLKVPLGNGYCAYGHFAEGACWYDGIGRC